MADGDTPLKSHLVISTDETKEEETTTSTEMTDTPMQTCSCVCLKFTHVFTSEVLCD